MDWLTFTSRALESLAWPIASVVLVVLLRKEINGLMPFLKRLKAGPLEAEFERELKELRAISSGSSAVPASSAKSESSGDLLIRLAHQHPRSAILEAWARVEATARAALVRRSLIPAGSPYLPAAKLVEPFSEQGLLHQGQVTLFHELRRLRNEVTHNPAMEPSLEATRSYIELSEQLRQWFELAGGSD